MVSNKKGNQTSFVDEGKFPQSQMKLLSHVYEAQLSAEFQLYPVMSGKFSGLRAADSVRKEKKGGWWLRLWQMGILLTRW